MSGEREIKVPDLGGFRDVEVIDVLVRAGERIREDDSLITLESDKAAMDVPSPVAGEVKALRVKVGDRVSAGDVVLIVALESAGDVAKVAGDETVPPESKPDAAPREPGVAKDERGPETVAAATGPEQSGSGEASPLAAQSSPPRDHGAFVAAHAGPAVRKFARELGVDLSRVSGSGRKGRITFADVKAHVKSALRTGGGGLPSVPSVDFSRFGKIERVGLSRLKRIAGPRLQAAWLNAPHVTQHDEADIGALEMVRKAMKPAAQTQGIRLTPLAFLVKAAVQALQAFPGFNASLDPDGETLILKHYYHVGFAVDTEQGLIVPVIRDADRKTVLEIAAELAALGEKARAGKLRREDIEGGSFSVSSLGSLGGTAFTPIINAPEVAILGVSRAVMKPQWNGREFEPRLMLPLSLSYDHRVIDGAQAVRFTRHLAATLETLRGLVA